MIEQWLDHQRARRFSPHTIARRRSSLGKLAAFLHPATLDQATPDDIEEWLATFPSPRTAHHYRSDARLYYRWAIRRGHAATNPVDGTDGPRLPRSLPRPLKVDQIAAALLAADHDTRLMILLGSHAGLRIREIVGLHSDDIDLGARLLVVRSGKGGRDRVVPLHPAVAAVLDGRAAGWVFPGRAGHLSANCARRRIESAFATVGVTMTPHQLRHSYGTACAEIAAGNLQLVARLMGHQSVQTTEIYAGWAPSRDALRVAERIYEPADPLPGIAAGRMVAR